MGSSQGRAAMAGGIARFRGMLCAGLRERPSEVCVCGRRDLGRWGLGLSGSVVGDEARG